MGLEGLLEMLRRDPRHHALKVLDRSPIIERSFPRWRMRRVGETQPALDELEGLLLEEGRGRPVPPEVRDFLAWKIAA